MPLGRAKTQGPCDIYQLPDDSLGGPDKPVNWSTVLHHSLAKALPEIMARERASAA